jgi:hypothetical protein
VSAKCGLSLKGENIILGCLTGAEYRMEPIMEEVTGKWRKLHNEEYYNPTLYQILLEGINDDE